ncbi:DUF1835 domain-containing protein [Chitinophaga sp. Cy-1792]|uniref:DUF1835 domain-containing protein n=1 Tax=Chitinophaga sp. Cy-1792 TaxID=2608339 RepID=UPI0014227350|nr:DUF1835 domain-containing protein [Chitinophaga sp. Cy-1792]NIG54324.1 DUF1835 domain-containing protein [Chitinophaga sp. Cy-1792]
MSLKHIVFGQTSVPVLAEAIGMDEKMQGDVLCFEEDLSVGPLFILDTKEGQAGRFQWWQQMQGIAPAAATNADMFEEAAPASTPEPEPEISGDHDRFRALKGMLKEDPELEIWIWAGQNSRDVAGYYWLVSQLYDFAGRVHIIYLNNLPFLNEKGAVFYPTHLHQILPKEFLKAKKLARPVSLAEFELDGDEWHRLMNENAGIRILEGGKKLKGEPATLYDKDLVAQAGKDFVKAWRVANQVGGKLKYPLPEHFLGWRLKELIREGKLDSRGELKTPKDFEVKLPGGGGEEATTAPVQENA